MTDPLGLAAGAVRVVAYDPRWPALFAAEQRRIHECCGELALRLEHVGGTSIPGLCAKPVLDVVAGRPQGAPLPAYIAALQQAGYTHRGEQGVPGREFFRRGEPRAYHVHLVEQGGPLWCDYLGFRDYLRGNARAAADFAAFKRALAQRFPRDRAAYIAAKSVRVREILALARGDGRILP